MEGPKPLDAVDAVLSRASLLAVSLNLSTPRSDGGFSPAGLPDRGGRVRAKGKPQLSPADILSSRTAGTSPEPSYLNRIGRKLRQPGLRPAPVLSAPHAPVGDSESEQRPGRRAASPTVAASDSSSRSPPDRGSPARLVAASATRAQSSPPRVLASATGAAESESPDDPEPWELRASDMAPHTSAAASGGGAIRGSGGVSASVAQLQARVAAVLGQRMSRYQISAVFGAAGPELDAEACADGESSSSSSSSSAASSSGRRRSHYANQLGARAGMPVVKKSTRRSQAAAAAHGSARATEGALTRSQRRAAPARVAGAVSLPGPAMPQGTVTRLPTGVLAVSVDPDAAAHLAAAVRAAAAMRRVGGALQPSSSAAALTSSTAAQHQLGAYGAFAVDDRLQSAGESCLPDWLLSRADFQLVAAAASADPESPERGSSAASAVSGHSSSAAGAGGSTSIALVRRALETAGPVRGGKEVSAIVRWLRGQTVFTALPAALLDTVARSATAVHVGPGHRLQPAADSVYVVLQGTLQISRGDGSAEVVTAGASLGPRRWFDRMAAELTERTAAASSSRASPARRLSVIAASAVEAAQLDGTRLRHAAQAAQKASPGAAAAASLSSSAVPRGSAGEGSPGLKLMVAESNGDGSDQPRSASAHAHLPTRSSVSPTHSPVLVAGTATHHDGAEAADMPRLALSPQPVPVGMPRGGRIQVAGVLSSSPPRPSRAGRRRNSLFDATCAARAVTSQEVSAARAFMDAAEKAAVEGRIVTLPPAGTGRAIAAVRFAGLQSATAVLRAVAGTARGGLKSDAELVGPYHGAPALALAAAGTGDSQPATARSAATAAANSGPSPSPRLPGSPTPRLGRPPAEASAGTGSSASASVSTSARQLMDSGVNDRPHNSMSAVAAVGMAAARLLAGWSEADVRTVAGLSADAVASGGLLLRLGLNEFREALEAERRAAATAVQRAIRSLPDFVKWTPSRLAALSRLFETRNAPAGAVLFEQGDPADALVLVTEGRVDLWRSVAVAVHHTYPIAAHAWTRDTKQRSVRCRAGSVAAGQWTAFDALHWLPLLAADAAAEHAVTGVTAGGPESPSTLSSDPSAQQGYFPDPDDHHNASHHDAAPAPSSTASSNLDEADCQWDAKCGTGPVQSHADMDRGIGVQHAGRGRGSRLSLARSSSLRSLRRSVATASSGTLGLADAASAAIVESFATIFPAEAPGKPSHTVTAVAGSACTVLLLRPEHALMLCHGDLLLQLHHRAAASRAAQRDAVLLSGHAAARSAAAEAKALLQSAFGPRYTRARAQGVVIAAEEEPRLPRAVSSLAIQEAGHNAEEAARRQWAHEQLRREEAAVAAAEAAADAAAEQIQSQAAAAFRVSGSESVCKTAVSEHCNAPGGHPNVPDDDSIHHDVADDDMAVLQAQSSLASLAPSSLWSVDSGSSSVAYYPLAGGAGAPVAAHSYSGVMALRRGISADRHDASSTDNGKRPWFERLTSRKALTRVTTAANAAGRGDTSPVAAASAPRASTAAGASRATAGSPVAQADASLASPGPPVDLSMPKGGSFARLPTAQLPVVRVPAAQLRAITASIPASSGGVGAVAIRLGAHVDGELGGDVPHSLLAPLHAASAAIKATRMLQRQTLTVAGVSASGPTPGPVAFVAASPAPDRDWQPPELELLEGNAASLRARRRMSPMRRRGRSTSADHDKGDNNATSPAAAVREPIVLHASDRLRPIPGLHLGPGAHALSRLASAAAASAPSATGGTAGAPADGQDAMSSRCLPLYWPATVPKRDEFEDEAAALEKRLRASSQPTSNGAAVHSGLGRGVGDGSIEAGSTVSVGDSLSAVAKVTPGVQVAGGTHRDAHVRQKPQASQLRNLNPVRSRLGLSAQLPLAPPDVAAAATSTVSAHAASGSEPPSTTSRQRAALDLLAGAARKLQKQSLTKFSANESVTPMPAPSVAGGGAAKAHESVRASAMLASQRLGSMGRMEGKLRANGSGDRESDTARHRPLPMRRGIDDGHQDYIYRGVMLSESHHADGPASAQRLDHHDGKRAVLDAGDAMPPTAAGGRAVTVTGGRSTVIASPRAVGHAAAMDLVRTSSAARPWAPAQGETLFSDTGSATSSDGIVAVMQPASVTPGHLGPALTRSHCNHHAQQVEGAGDANLKGAPAAFEAGAPGPPAAHGSTLTGSRGWTLRLLAAPAVGLK